MKYKFENKMLDDEGLKEAQRIMGEHIRKQQQFDLFDISLVPNPEAPILTGQPETLFPAPQGAELDRAKLLEERICDRLDEEYNGEDPIYVEVDYMPTPPMWEWLRGRFTAWDVSWSSDPRGIKLECK